MGLDDFVYNPDHRVIVCRRCKTCLIPKVASWKSHLRAEPHRMRGQELRTVVELFSSYQLRSVDELRQQKPDKTRPCWRIEGVACFGGQHCTHGDCGFSTRRLEKMFDHMPVHERKASQNSADAPLWRTCMLQTYFTAKGLIDYFVVECPPRPPPAPAPSPSLVPVPKEEVPTSGLNAPPSLSQEEESLFDGLRADMSQASRDLDERAGAVQGTEAARADRVPWLVRTGFPMHLQGLRDTEIQSSYSLPPPGKKTPGSRDDGGEGGADTDLARILTAAEATLRDAYRLCSDTSPDRKMTQQRAKQLGEFREGGSNTRNGWSRAFRSFKNESSLTSYFCRMKQLLAYYYRVVFREDGHFSREAADQVLPRDVIETTDQQQRAMDRIIEALRTQDEKAEARAVDEKDGGVGDRRRDDDDGGDGDDAAELKHAIRNFYVALICQRVGSRPFRSVVLSFCAMLSRKDAFTSRGANGGDKQPKQGKQPKQQRGGKPGNQRVWHEPGNFNSSLSALTWTAQLVLFDFVCFQKQDDEDGIPELLEKMCTMYFHQMAETPFGHILQWRLYLFVASRTGLARNQARWSLDGQTITYMGTQLRMEQVSELAVSEFRQAHQILHDQLLFGAPQDIAPIEAWRLHDDLDLEDYGGSWLTDGRNTEILQGTQDALLRQIERRAEWRRTFVRTDERDGRTYLCPQAIAVYEAHIQEFLKRMVTLVLVPPGPPLRSPELLSITYANTGSRRRSIMIWEKLVMVYVRYHKSQEQTGAEKDNVRFLPAAIGDMLLTYLALVLPLRQIFLRQSKPGALLSPYLWSTLDGEVWRDTSVSSCLRRACARAVVPQFQVAWWRQAAASITKEKFSARERANFDLEDAAATEEVEEEAELAYLAGMSNHSFRTFNHSYAGSTTLTVSTLLHRAHRASQSWRDLFRFDQLLQGKRPRAVSDAEARRLLDTCKKARFRARPAAREDTLVAVARGLHNDPDLQLRRPGQRDAMLATVGPRAADDVVAVLATGSGKTLVVMVAAALEGAATTILILPTVALRRDMIGRLNRVRLRHHVWSPGSTKSAPLVIASAEAACTPGFLGYAHRLADRRQLDRIVVDECHLTITASDYRRSMSQLAWYVRQVRTQTVWLTATLPPIYRELFLEHNKLVRPRIVRESTNRPNLRYIVRRERGLGGLSERAARLVQACCEGADLLQGERDRIILYCPTKELVAELADMLDCPSYTADSGTESEKAAIIEQWLGAADSRAIVATSALGPGFDYPHVRWVIHVGPPDLMTNFSQESGRAGRDGKPAESIVLLSAAWQPRLDRPLGRDEEAMQLYLTQQDCSRSVLSRFLDEKEDWRWCMEGEDELCEVCPKHHTERRPSDLELRLPAPDTPTGPRGSNRPEQVESGGGGVRGPGRDAEYAGPDEVLRQDMVQEDTLGRFEADLETMRGCCLLCRVQGGRPFDDHRATSCSRRWSWIKAKTAVMRSCERDGRPWMADFAACFWCYLPQTICRRADPEAEEDGEEAEKECRFRDMVMPLCYGAFYRPGPRALVKERFRQSFRDIDDYMRWLGQSATLGGVPCVQAVCVAAVLLAEFG